MFCFKTKASKNPTTLRGPDVLAQGIVVPRVALLGQPQPWSTATNRGQRRGVEDLKTALDQFREIAKI